MCCSMAQFDSLPPHGLRHTRLPCPSLSPGVGSNSRPLDSVSAIPPSHPVTLCSGPQSSPASGSFPMSWLFASGGQSIGVSASASVLPMNIQDWFSSGLTSLISLQPKELKSLLQHHSSKASTLWRSAFFTVQLSHPYMTAGKTISWPDGPLLAK